MHSFSAAGGSAFRPYFSHALTPLTKNPDQSGALPSPVRSLGTPASQTTQESPDSATPLRTGMKRFRRDPPKESSIDSRPLHKRRPVWASLREPQKVKIKCGMKLVAECDREALLRSIPGLSVAARTSSFRCVILTTGMFKRHDIINAETLRCFSSLCEAIHTRGSLIGRYTLTSLRGAWILARSLKANGVMVLAQKLLERNSSALGSEEEGIVMEAILIESESDNEWREDSDPEE